MVAGTLSYGRNVDIRFLALHVGHLGLAFDTNVMLMILTLWNSNRIKTPL